MAVESVLIGVGKLALEEGVKFLYAQAEAILAAWRERRRNPAALPPSPVIVPPPPQVTVGTPRPGADAPKPDTVLKLTDLAATVREIADGKRSADDASVRTEIDALREAVEAALGTTITFEGEPPRQLRIADVNVVVKDVHGRAAGVRVDLGEWRHGADITKVRVGAQDVRETGEVVGVDATGSRASVVEQRPPDRRIRLLFLAANPVDTQPLRLDEEMRAIDNALREAEYRDRFEIAQQWAVRIGDLQTALLRHRPDIVHFSGHGTDSSEIALEDEEGRARAVPREALSRLFSILLDNIRCVVLNACYSEHQALAIAEHVDCVVGMTSAVGDADAIAFATGFYQAVGYGRDVETAFNLGTNLMGLRDMPDEDKPKLISKKIDARQVSFAR